MYTMQALWELKALKLFLSTLATSAFKHVLHIVWLILLLLQHPMSWLLPQFSMTIVAGMQVPMALLEAATRHEIASATPAARALQWQRCFVHALIFWVKDCSVAYGLASLARSAAHHPSHCKVCNANLPPQTCAMPPWLSLYVLWDQASVTVVFRSWHRGCACPCCGACSAAGAQHGNMPELIAVA